MCLEAPHRSLAKRGTSVVFITIHNIVFPFGIIAMSTNGNILAQHQNPSASYIGAGSRLLPHGGKRSAKPRSGGLTAANAVAIVTAGAASLAKGAPFNRFVTVHWGALGVGDDLAFKATSMLMTFARDWLRDRGVKAFWLWVRENDDGDGSKGSHVHWLLHLPETHREAFNSRLRGWCIKAAGAGRYVKNALKSLPVGRHVDTHATAPDIHRTNLREVLAYVLKGLTPQASQMAAHRLNTIWASNDAAMPNPGTGGVVIGKRVGFSRGVFQADFIVKR
jgi:hypothetical protein